MPNDHSLDVAHVHSFTLGECLVDPKACQVSCGDRVVKLRPQLVDVLVCLARHAGKIVLKDELLKAVWPGQYVAESGLSRCVAELRQILQDDAQQPRYIETVMKRGYRLVAPVVWLTTEDGVAQESGRPAPEAGAPAPGAGHPATEAGDPTPEAGALTQEATTVPAIVEAGRKRRVFAGRAIWSAIAVLLIVAGVTTFVLLTRTPAKILTDRDTVLLADMRNTTGNPIFDDTLRLALAVNLEQAPFLHILPQEVVRDAVARAGRSPDERVVGPLALDVCRREGVAALLAGSIALLGSRYAIGIEAIACESGDAIARVLVEAAGKDRVLGALQEAATRIREKLGESHDSLRQHGLPLERATTSSLDALKALTLGDRNRDQYRLAEAMALYRRATDLDPNFALAWARRGAMARNLGLRDEMTPAFRRAYELRDRVSAPERFFIEAHYVFEEDPEKALEIYQAWGRMYPGSSTPRNNVAALLSGMLGRYDEALPEAREAVRLAPGASVGYRNLGLACLGTGRIDEARQTLAAAAKRGIANPLIAGVALNIAVLDGDRAALERETGAASGDPLLGLRLRASVAMAEGRLREARRLWSATLEKAVELGAPSRVAEMRRYQAEAEALLGDAGAAREAVRAALASDARPLTLPSVAIVFALVGDSDRAAAVLDNLARQPAPDSAAFRRVSLPAARALVEAVRGHADKAAEVLRPVTRYARGSDYALVPLGVSAVVGLRAGRPAEAVVAFRDLIQLRPVVPESPWVAFGPLGLARALRETGDIAGSRRTYERCFEQWRDADPDLPVLLQAKREYAALPK
jgi:eukaryotic-like serine/threonine-protein kinase